VKEKGNGEGADSVDFGVNLFKVTDKIEIIKKN